MSILDEIDKFCDKVESNIPQKGRKAKIKLYASGLKSKILQCNFALSNLHSLSLKDDKTTSTTESSVLDFYGQVAFYCDTFCVFLYSSLDILSQIINQFLSIGMDEKRVDFNHLKRYLTTNHPGTFIETSFKKIYNSRSCKNMNKYRNCSLHRRQIYINETSEFVRHTEGYTISSTQDNIPNVVRKICDNPYDMNPKINQNRILPIYLENTKKYLLDEIEKIIQNLSKESERI